MNWDFTGMSRPGPGVPPGAPRKKGAARFWEMLTRDFGSLLGANLLCFAAFLPAALAVSLGLYLGNFWVSLLGGLAGGALAGPFYMALADTALRTLQDDPTGWFGRWRSTLAGHWRPAAVTGMALGGLIAVFLFVGSFFLAAMQQEELPALPIWMVLAVDLFLLSLFGVTLPFQLALGRPGFLARLKEGALELLFHPGRVAGAALFQLLWWALLLAMFPISVPFALFLGFWPAALLTGQMLYPVLQSRFELPDYRPAPSPAPAEGYTPAQRSEIWWRLHWGWVLAAVCAASFGLGIVYTLASRSDPDLEVAVVTADYLPDACRTACAPTPMTKTTTAMWWCRSTTTPSRWRAPPGTPTCRPRAAPRWSPTWRAGTARSGSCLSRKPSWNSTATWWTAPPPCAGRTARC